MKAIIHPTDKLAGRICAQPSKNYTTRYLYAAALADGESIVENIALSEDATALLSCLQTFGAKIDFIGKNSVKVQGFGRNPLDNQTVDPGNAGTVLRFLISCAILTKNTTFVTEYKESLGVRPNIDLLAALEQIGVTCQSGVEGRLPIQINGIAGKDLPEILEIKVSGYVSSQYLSSLLFIAPLLDREVNIQVINGLKSKPLIGQTLEVMKEAGVKVRNSEDLLSFHVEAGQNYKASHYKVGGDHPGTAAVISACSVMESDVVIENLFDDAQGEKRVIGALQSMGAPVQWDGSQVIIKGKGDLKGIVFDGDKATDGVLALSAASAMAEGKTRFVGVENLRYKECDRITDWGNELKKLGVNFQEEQDAFEIIGNPEGYEGGIVLDSHIDHRVIMGLTIVGMCCRKKITITEAQHIAKSYPGFFEHMKELGAKIEIQR